MEYSGWRFRIFAGRLLDSVGLERILVPSIVVLAIGLGLIGATGRVEMLDAAGVVGGIGHALLYPALSAMVIARTEIGATGRSSSIYQSLYDIGAMVGSYGLGAIAGLIGYAPMFVVSGALALVGSLFFLAVDPDAGLFRAGWDAEVRKNS